LRFSQHSITGYINCVHTGGPKRNSCQRALSTLTNRTDH